MLSYQVQVKVAGLTSFLSSQTTGTSAAIIKTLKQWAMRYRAAMQDRFIQQSSGGGEWPPLKPATIKRRRGKQQNVRILRDTGTLLQSLEPIFLNAPGALEQTDSTQFLVEVGYGGPGMHPSGVATVADIAKFHQFGQGHLPVREIIVQPPQYVLSAMARDAERNLQQEAKDTIGGN